MDAAGNPVPNALIVLRLAQSSVAAMPMRHDVFAIGWTDIHGIYVFDDLATRFRIRCSNTMGNDVESWTHGQGVIHHRDIRNADFGATSEEVWLEGERQSGKLVGPNGQALILSSQTTGNHPWESGSTIRAHRSSRRRMGLWIPIDRNNEFTIGGLPKAGCVPQAGNDHFNDHHEQYYSSFAVATSRRDNSTRSLRVGDRRRSRSSMDIVTLSVHLPVKQGKASSETRTILLGVITPNAMGSSNRSLVPTKVGYHWSIDFVASTYSQTRLLIAIEPFATWAWLDISDPTIKTIELPKVVASRLDSNR
ncbi:MAG: hypothetical protein U0905_15005 [Pirellulales bacterium]